MGVLPAALVPAGVEWKTVRQLPVRPKYGGMVRWTSGACASFALPFRALGSVLYRLCCARLCTPGTCFMVPLAPGGPCSTEHSKQHTHQMRARERSEPCGFSTTSMGALTEEGRRYQPSSTCTQGGPAVLRAKVG